MSVANLRLLIAAAGILIWFLGQRAGDERLRWVGIGFIVVAVLLRFVIRGRKTR